MVTSGGSRRYRILLQMGFDLHSGLKPWVTFEIFPHPEGWGYEIERRLKNLIVFESGDSSYKGAERWCYEMNVKSSWVSGSCRAKGAMSSAGEGRRSRLHNVAKLSQLFYQSQNPY